MGLIVGADDIDGVVASEPGTLGPRRTALEEIRGNIRAAGLEPVERDGQFVRLAAEQARMKPVRLGAVDYLNARPLVYGLELRHGFALQFDPPSKCAALLHEGSIDVGMIPSIEYLRRPNYCAVPDMAIVSEGPVASVAMFTTKPIQDIRTIAADTSSRTSNALLRVLCRERFGIDRVHPDGAPADRHAAPLRRGARHRRCRALFRSRAHGRPEGGSR